MYCINYVVKKGDTLYSISRRYKVGLDSILYANPMVNVYNLQVGDVICIPASVPHNNYTNITTYLVEEQDTLGTILDKFNINLADLMELNDLNSIYIEPGSTLQIPIIDDGEDEITL